MEFFENWSKWPTALDPPMSTITAATAAAADTEARMLLPQPSSVFFNKTMVLYHLMYFVRYLVYFVSSQVDVV